MGKDFIATIHDPARKKEFLEIFGSDQVYLRSFIPNTIKVEGVQDPQTAYFLDLDLLSSEQLEKLIKHLAQKFNLSIDFVRNNIQEIGVPVLAQEVSVEILNPWRWI